ncbi:hypothetical protein GCM10023350_42340 [Nocardioides endophyticus]|uniref:Nudix hydrolase domain-containing protein n=1 Tax=Nocardioides endophyticus TaxID=1353775 RepID=A0ABP8ZCG7_9ACTN
MVDVAGTPLVSEASSIPAYPGMLERTVVAVVLTWRGRIGLFKRSPEVGHDGGLWHCITGFVELGHQPLEKAVTEVHEETGLGLRELDDLVAGPVLELPALSGPPWQVHTFSARTQRRRLELNWEHSTYRWVRPAAVAGFGGQVVWLADVVRATDASIR